MHQHWLQERFNHRYLEFVRQYSDIIVGQFFGHQHSDTFRIFRDATGKLRLNHHDFRKPKLEETKLDYGFDIQFAELLLKSVDRGKRRV